ncbi:WGR domain-containing protein [Paracoccus sp. ME4]|uniref:WGR domain-containing protein n=1 Tax=Paracoccus sp. ME4 TaxID=3138066 RepID=UPI00398B30BF
MMSIVVSQISLFLTEGSSDKVYNVQLCQEADGYAVRAQNGRRGKALRDQVKGTAMSEADAREVYDKLVASKVKGGYTDQESGVAFSSAMNADTPTGWVPQLLNEISPAEAAALGDDWLFQEKHDGERRGLIFDEGRIVFANRKGLETGIQQPIADAFTRLTEVVGGRLILDAEDMGDHVVIFDVPAHFMIQEGTFRERASILAHLEKTITNLGLGGQLRVDVPVPASEFFAGGEALLREGNAEGFVARKADSLYTVGRPASGGNALKVKYWADITCRVAAGRIGKSSVAIELLDEAGDWTPVGNVTINGAPMPEVGSLIDVKYLYAYKGGSLFQPTYLRPRTDLDASECRIDRLKMKRVPDAPAPAPEDEMSPGM